MHPRLAIAAFLFMALASTIAHGQNKYAPMDLKVYFTAGPLSDPQPPNTLLPAEATSVDLTVRAATPTVCRYSVGRDLPFDQMTPFDAAAPSSAPKTTIRGLDPDTRHLNDVYIRCDADRNAVLHLQYRALPAVKPGFPRVANLWGSWNFAPKGMQYASRIDLWLGASFTPDQIVQLRQLNPNCFILESINTVENNDVPDSYFLRDVNGKKIEVWPGAYRLNITRPEVAEYQARYAYEKMLKSGLSYDGCFFDNFMMSQSWQTHDIYDHSVQIDADGDGKPDKPADLDRAWRAGVFHELQAWRKMMPWALTTGHSQGYPHPDIAEIFNGQGIGFMTTDVIEGKASFAELWDYYNAWCTVTVKPAITSVESAVPDQIAYGYDFEPHKKMPPSTWDFARDYYPYMRFGLAFTLMNDGYFSHELGDTDHGQDWWYDELDFKLGAPTGPATQIPVGQADTHNLIDNGNFARALDGNWYIWADQAAGCAATLVRQPNANAGRAAAHVTVTSAGQPGRIEFAQNSRKLQKGHVYDLSFRARATGITKMTVISSKGSPDWDNYGLIHDIALTPEWQLHTLTFDATRTVADARIQFILGGVKGEVWIDDVSLTEHRASVQRRDFANGIVLLNGTRSPQTINVGEGYRHLIGKQAPRYQYIIDDGAPGFATTGLWQEEPLGTKDWNAIPPYYHAWNNRCRMLNYGAIGGGGGGAATWDLQLRGPGTYTVQAWWAAAPNSNTWVRKAVYEIVSNGKALASITLDQTQAGDQWHTICENLPLTPGDKPIVRLRAETNGILVADALHIFSAERLNDGQEVRQVYLEPMDGVVLQRAPAAAK